MKNGAIYSISNELLQKSLSIDPDCEIKGVEWDYGKGGIRLFVEGDSLPSRKDVGASYPIIEAKESKIEIDDWVWEDK